jgi:hypothetical protein
LKKLAAFLLCFVLLGGTVLKFTLVCNYWLNKAEITRLFCQNTAKPELKCDGKCHLAKQLKKADSSDERSQNTIPDVKILTLDCAFVTSDKFSLMLKSKDLATQFYYPCSLLQGSGNSVFQPPKG